MKDLVNFLFEANSLKRIKRTGWQILGQGEESVAEHLAVSAIIGYTLAKLAKGDKEKVVLMCLFHNFYEARLGDLHSLAQHYLNKDGGRKRIEKDAFGKLPFGKEVLSLIKEYRERKTLEARLAKDADALSFMIQLKEFIDLGAGESFAREWFSIHKKTRLRTGVGRKLGEAIEKGRMHDWWEDIRGKIARNWERE